MLTCPDCGLFVSLLAGGGTLSSADLAPPTCQSLAQTMAISAAG